MEEPICSRCGSTNVLKDAYAQWDKKAQEWTLQNTFDDSFCEECEGPAKLDWRQITPAPKPQSESRHVLGQFFPHSREEAVNMILKSAQPHEGKRYAQLPEEVRQEIMRIWSLCASWLESPARPIVRDGVVDLSWYHAKAHAA